MGTHQQLVDEWKTKLSASARTDQDEQRRFDWVRQVYTRIYRFLVSCYGEAEWRGANDDLGASASGHLSPNTSRMPFVDYRSTTDGLAPKSPERIRAALDSIHSTNPGIATAGTMSGVKDDTWVVVAASKKSRYVSAVHRRLVACPIEAHLYDRTTDTAVIVRHEDFQRALGVVRKIGPAIQFKIARKLDPVSVVGVVLLVASLFTCVAVVAFFRGTLQQATPVSAVFALWIAGLLASWLCVRGHRAN